MPGVEVTHAFNHWDKAVESHRANHPADYILGFDDRKGVFRSTLASEAIGQALKRVGVEYLMRRPPCFLNEPYEIQWVMSYCDTRLHRGTVYRAAGFELYRTNDDGIQTWRKRISGLTPGEHAAVRDASRKCPRANRYRAKRSQLALY